MAKLFPGNDGNYYAKKKEQFEKLSQVKVTGVEVNPLLAHLNSLGNTPGEFHVTHGINQTLSFNFHISISHYMELVNAGANWQQIIHHKFSQIIPNEYFEFFNVEMHQDSKSKMIEIRGTAHIPYSVQLTVDEPPAYIQPPSWGGFQKSIFDEFSGAKLDPTALDGHTVKHTLRELVPDFSELVQFPCDCVCNGGIGCPSCQPVNVIGVYPDPEQLEPVTTSRLKHQRRPLWETVVILNDHCHWDRARIADWMETLDLDLRFRKPEEKKIVRRPGGKFAALETTDIQTLTNKTLQGWNAAHHNHAVVNVKVDMTEIKDAVNKIAASFNEAAKKAVTVAESVKEQYSLLANIKFPDSPIISGKSITITPLSEMNLASIKFPPKETS